jgi:hypothetical protein
MGFRHVTFFCPSYTAVLAFIMTVVMLHDAGQRFGEGWPSYQSSLTNSSFAPSQIIPSFIAPSPIDREKIWVFDL